MLVHGDLKPVLGAVLAVEGRGMVVEVYDVNRDRGDVVVQQLIVRSYFSCLSLNRLDKRTFQ